MKDTAPFVITISRELGSGGAYIGRQLAKKLDVFYADREIIGQAARELSVLQEDVAAREEKILSFWQSLIQSFAAAPDVYVPPQIAPPTDQELFQAESEIITRIARERSAVIIGRCGAYILRTHPHHLSVFLHANVDFRTERIRKLYKVSVEAAQKMIAESDQARAAYNSKFTGRYWTDARQYNLALDTSEIGIDKTVELIGQYLTFRR
ncbi:MAG: cytidylate kinase [Smithella sp. PtaU1.Bin162]|jgi:cytidylate kinase|nr:MAG: cytidylate kinase [Smithella sp. PtaU1.Bin162]